MSSNAVGSGEYAEFAPLADAVGTIRDLKARANDESLPLADRFDAERQAVGAEKVLRRVREAMSGLGDG
jgi:hypothetical protein